MRLTSFSLAAVAFAGMAFAQAPAGQNAGPERLTLSQDELRHRAVAVNMQDGTGRIKRPNTWESLTPDQQAFVDAVLSSPRGSREFLSKTPVLSPMGILLPSPVMGKLFEQAQAYARFGSSNPPKYNELAILIAAKTWNSNYAWRAHNGSALAAGISPEIVEAVRVGKRPANMPPDIEAVYNFCTEFLTTHQASDATFAAVKKAVGGDQGVVDLTATMGFYQMISMFINVDRFPLPAGVKPENLIPGAPIFR
jgi:4-carboxymuconolactone decarboxylase